MDVLRLHPQIGVRDVHVTFDVGKRTISTHIETQKNSRAVVSLVDLLESLKRDGRHPILRCNCRDAACAEIEAVSVSRTVDDVTWTVGSAKDAVEYRFDPAQVESELDAATSVIQAAIDKTHHSAWRFEPATDKELFPPRTEASRRWHIQNNVVWFAAVIMVSAGIAWLARAVR